ncbi:MAG: TonB-dependent receptor [Novosphingobium sp.]|nr:TonB-dependent receptor [Novosphingobium sp.]
MKYRASILSTAAIAVLLTAQPVHAQEAGSETQVQESYLGEIVVLARKRAERLQDVPIAVTAMSGDALTNQSVQSFRDIQEQTPSLSINPISGDRNATAISLRGQSQTDALLTVDPAVGIYLDGVNISKTISTEMSNLVDIDRVEVLKGPQGTLFGRNTTGGAINIFYKQPTDRFEGKLIVRTDEYRRAGGALILNVPLASTLALRVVGQYDKRDGYGINRFDGRQVGGDLNGGSLRGTLRWAPTDDVEVLIRGDYNKSDTSTLPWHVIGIRNPSAILSIIGTQGGNAASILAQSSDYRDINHNWRNRSRIESWGTSATVSIRLNDAVEFKSITSWRELDRLTQHDLDATAYNLIHVRQPTHQEVFTQEGQLSGVALDDRLNWIVGAFYSRETGTDGTRTVNFNATTNVDGRTVNVTDGSVKNTSIAGFAQATFKFTDQFSLTGGLRYTKDTKVLVSRNHVDRPLGTFLSCNLPVALVGTATTAEACTAHLKDSYDDLSYMATVDFKPRDGLLVYLRTARGYKAGGFNLRGGADPLTFQPFDPETVTDYEIGLKSDWFDRRLRVNLAGYISKYDGIQRTVIVGSTLPPPAPPTLTVVRNAAKGTIKGVEAEVTAVPVDGLTLRGSAGYVHARYDSYMSNGVDRSFERFPYQPTWNWSVSSAYEHRMASGPMRFQVDYAYKGGQDGAPSSLTDPVTKGWVNIKGYGLTNARISKAFDREGVDVAFFVKNLFNKKYRTTILDFSGSLGYVLDAKGDPRIIGAEASLSF